MPDTEENVDYSFWIYVTISVLLLILAVYVYFAPRYTVSYSPSISRVAQPLVAAFDSSSVFKALA